MCLRSGVLGSIKAALILQLLRPLHTVLHEKHQLTLSYHSDCRGFLFCTPSVVLWFVDFEMIHSDCVEYLIILTWVFNDW